MFFCVHYICRGVYIGGHSAGGHLTAMMLSQEWSNEELSLIKGNQIKVYKGHVYIETTGTPTVFCYLLNH